MARLPQVGLGLLLLLLTASAGAQVGGEIESVGFDSNFRNDCWTPMVLTIDPGSATTEKYEVHVKVQDMDRDLAIYSREITVTGAAEGQNLKQKFRMYFIPPPVDDGLPDASDPAAYARLQERVKVSLYTSGSNSKWVCDLPFTGSLHNVDPKDVYNTPRGAKMILCITDGRSRPVYLDAGSSNVLGMMEDLRFVLISPRDLPENVLGYDAVDGVVWFDSDPAELKSAGDEKYRALESYVQRGGKLVICQPFEWQKTLGFGDLLPVTINGVVERNELGPLRQMAVAPNALQDALPSIYDDPFANLRAPFRIARATAKPNTTVAEWIHWGDNDDSPYIVRGPRGLGSVTWVAQDLGDPNLTRIKAGWVYVWNRVLDLRDTPFPVSNNTPISARQLMEHNWTIDVGRSLISGMDLTSKSTWLITLAIFFFIGYWVIAGPGAFTFLATRKQAHLSWFVYGGTALAAAALTGLIVKLVLRGPAEVKHFSIVKVAPDQPAVVTSRLGLYIPRDGAQRIELTDVTPNAMTYIEPFPIHPAFLNSVPEQTGTEYYVPIADAAAGKAAAITYTYRSTLKKFQANWVGDVASPISGRPRLLPVPEFIGGTLTNNSSEKLRNVYIAFNYSHDVLNSPLNIGDWMLYLPAWEPGASLDLTRVFNRDENDNRLFWDVSTRVPDGSRRIRGRIAEDWGPYMMTSMGAGPLTDTYDDSSFNFRRSLPLMSFFERLAPTVNQKNQQPKRVDLLRRGGRLLDMSPALSAGQMVILAEQTGPLPMKMEVEDEPVTGTGSILYQLVLPLDRSAIESTTQPSIQPTTAPGE
jgi:hypothetical protein